MSGKTARDATGAASSDTLNGNSQSNDLMGRQGHDILDGNKGNDVIYGNRGNDKLFGGNGRDRLDGGASIDTLDGGNGNDKLIGGGGADWLNGGAGRDKLYGGKLDQLEDGQKDVFYFASITESGGDAIDQIYGFESGIDMIDLSAINPMDVTMRLTRSGESTMIEGHMDDDGTADFEIYVHNVTSISLDDFVL